MTITATEFKMNLSKYLLLANEEDIHITKNGKEIATLTSPVEEKQATLFSLVGIAKDLEGVNIKEERLLHRKNTWKNIVYKDLRV